MAKQKVKIPPQDLEAEQSVLGALMLDKNAVASVADLLESNDFYKKAHGVIFEAIIRLWDKQEPIDILSVTSELKKKNQLKEVGGSSYLTDLVNSVPTASHILHYGKIVKEKRVLRDLINISANITEEAFSSEGEIDDFMDDVEKKIFSISQQSISKNFLPLRDELQKAYERIERLHEGGGEKYRGVPTGFRDLDSILSGLQRSDLIIVGARPSYGKTTFALDIARYVAVELKQPVGVFSLEMSREQVIDRMIAAEAQVDLWKLRTGRLKDDLDFEMIQAALHKLSEAPLFVDDTPSPTVVQMRAMARRLQAEHKGLALLVADYLQLIQPRKGIDNSVQQVTEISRGLKGLARELNVPILAVSQLSRGVEQREVKIPRLSDLRESGSIEQDADVVLFVHPKDRGRADIPAEDENITEIIIAKHRNGPLGTVQLYFDKQKVTFRSLEKSHESNEGS
ncbi:MAG: replicative DNA helicase [Candidatus Colwellbacteria bacterium]|nr:replicative DNA helicase [Candidatus Colwellbacteria bacterium]